MKPEISDILNTLRNPTSPSNYELELLIKALFDMMTLEQEFQVAYQFIKLNSAYFLKQYPELSWVKRWLRATGKFEPINYQDENFAFYDDYESKEAHWFAYAISVADSTHRCVVKGDTKENLDLHGENLGYSIAIIVGTRMEKHRRTYFPEITIEEEIKLIKHEELIARVEKYKTSESKRQLQKFLWSLVADCMEAYSGL